MRFNIDQTVGAKVHRINVDHGARPMRQFGYFRNGIDGSHSIGSIRNGDNFRLRAELAFEVVQIESAIRLRECPPGE